MDAFSVPCDHETENAMQSPGRDEEWAPRLTRTDPSRTAHHRQPDTPAGRNKTIGDGSNLRHTVSYEVNAILLQYASNLLNVPLIHAGNANGTVNLTVTVLHNFKLKRDTVQTKNDFPAQ